MKFYNGAIVGNAAAMGFNWIYNLFYLEKLSKKQSMVFQDIDPAKYKRAGKSYLVYLNAKIGSVSLQGEILKWLYQALKENQDIKESDYADLIYDKIKPGGSYYGYIESYAKNLIFNKLVSELKLDIEPLQLNDNQLVGFVPYIAVKQLGKKSQKAWELAQAFTVNEDFLKFYNLFDELVNKITKLPLKVALSQVIDLAPLNYQEVLHFAIESTETNSFIQHHSGTACHIPQAIPLIFHIMAITNSFEEAIELNTRIGGASCDRGMLIGAILAQVYSIPEEWVKKAMISEK